MNASLFLQTLGGSIPCADVSIGDFNGGTPVTDGKLCVSTGIGGYFLGGLQYTADGRLCVNVAPAARIAGYVKGLPLGPAGRVVCTTGVEIVRYARGVPLSANNKVVLESIPGTLSMNDVEDPNAEQDSKASEDDGGSSAQPSVRAEGGDTPKRGKRVQSGGRGRKSATSKGAGKKAA